jgi:hypothetical protein
MKNIREFFGFKKNIRLTLFLLIMFFLIIHIKLIHETKITNLKYGKVIDEDYDGQIKFNTFPMQRNEEWEQLTRLIFFKRSASYYFIDQSVLRLFFVALSGIEFNFQIHLTLKNENVSATFRLNQLNINCDIKTNVYDFCSISANFDLTKTLTTQLVEKMAKVSSMEVHIVDQVSNLITQYPINVKMKYLKSNPINGIKKKGYAICNKCFNIRLDDTDSYKTYAWWLEINKRMGYDKAILCNVSMPNTPEYNNVFYKYRDFIEIHQLKYTPNLINIISSFSKKNKNGDSRSYFRNYSELKGKGGSFSYKYSGVFQNLRINECYLDNVDKYEYIAVIDIDELIVPRNKFSIKNYFDFITNFNFDSCSLLNPLNCLNKKLKDALELELEYQITHKALPEYANKLYPKETLHFSNGYYLKYETLDQIISHLDNHINNRRIGEGISYSNIVNIKDYNTLYNYSFSFLIESESDMRYAKNMVMLYKLVLKPKYINLNQEVIKNNSPSYFNRIAYLAHNTTTIQIPGKTLHYTDSTYFISIHHTKDRHITQPYEVGHVSHFRPKYSHYFENKTIPIKALAFDLNYLYCFYKNILQSEK